MENLSMDSMWIYVMGPLLGGALAGFSTDKLGEASHILSILLFISFLMFPLLLVSICLEIARLTHFVFILS